MTRKRSSSKQKIVDAAKRMPPLYHTLPGEKFEYYKSKTLWWIVKQPEVLSFLWNLIETSGAIVYDKKTGKWQGVDFVPDEDD